MKTSSARRSSSGRRSGSPAHSTLAPRSAHRRPMSTRLLLVRHGQIAANLDARWHGSTDGALTEQGREEARQVAVHLARTRPGFAAVYTSPLQRARDTAAAIAGALGAPLVVE